MASFEEILTKPASEIKAPDALPVGTYHCIVEGPPEQGKSSQKGTDYLEFKFKIMSPMDDVNAAEAAEQQVVGKIIRQQYYITDGASWRIVEFLRDSLGIPETNIKEMMMQAPNKSVLVKLRHEASPDGKRRFHRVESTAHV